VRVAIVLLLAFASACTSGPPPPAADGQPYEERVLAARAEKDEIFRTDDGSPLPPAERPGFPGLVYFPVDPAYRVPAILVEARTEPPVIIELDNSANQRELKRRVGVLQFALNGTSYSLSAFADVSASTVDQLFVPFGDLTNRDETYGGGRYLDLHRTATGLYDLDFNRAYHPYCVYNIAYVCPLPPRENRLDAAIRAGERLPAP
jgi:uncharacterized protein (DUF1684 family)